MGLGDMLGGLFGSSPGKFVNTVSPEQVAAAQAEQKKALGMQGQFANAVMGNQGLQNQASVFGQQQALANQLQGMTTGAGPNPALAQLQQITGQNIAAQNALMAGQRGAGANVGLMARQAGMQGGAMQQQATGQAAIMQAQQQMAAINALQQQQGMMGGMTNNMVGQQMGAVGQYGQAAAQNQGALMGAAAQQNQIAQQQQAANSQLLGSMVGAGAAALTTGGAGSGLMTMFGGGGKMADGMAPASSTLTMPSGYLNRAHGGVIPQPNHYVNYFNTMMQGGQVPGMNAGGTTDSLKNDTVPTMLSPGEIVIPKSVVNGPNPKANAAKFVEAILAKQGLRK